MIYVRLFILSLITLQVACSKVDDYMLGKDNTPKPTPLATIKPKLTFSKQWAKNVGANGKNARYLKLTPAFYDNVIYTADNNGLLTANSSKTSKTLWRTKLKSKIVSGPFVSSKYVAVAGDNANIYVLNTAKGNILWSKPLSNEVLSISKVVNGLLLAKTIDGKLYAFNADNGEKRWVFEHGSPSLILKASSKPVIKHDLAIVGNPDGKLDGINLNTGQLLWQRSIAYPRGASEVERLVDIDATPIVVGDTVYTASYQGYITALSLSSGNFLWRQKLSTYKDLAFNGKAIFATDSADVITAFSPASGRILWRQTGLKSRHVSAPVVLNKEVLIVADRQGVVHALSTRTGAFLSRIVLQGTISSTPVVAGNAIFVESESGSLTKLSMRT